MYDSFTAQLAGLDLAGFSFRPAPFNETDFPAEEASEQTLAAVWSDLFALFADTALEADAEDIAWGFVNLFHRAASRKSAQVDRASDEIRALLASADGSEIHSSNLEEQVERAHAAEASMLTERTSRPRLSMRAIFSRHARSAGVPLLRPKAALWSLRGGARPSPRARKRSATQTISGPRSTECASKSPTCSSSMAATARAPIGSPPRGPNATKCSN